MDNIQDILKKIKALEYSCLILAVFAPWLSRLINFNDKFLGMLVVGAIGISLQPVIYTLYKKANIADTYIKNRFWPLVLGLFFIVFLVIRRYYFD